MTSRLEYLFVGAFMAILMGAVAQGIYWLLIDTAPPVEYGAVNVTNVNGVNTRTFRSGETMLVIRDLCVNRKVPAHIDRRLVSIDGKLAYYVDSSTSVMPIGCLRGTRAVNIPRDIPPGQYRYVVTSAFQINPLTRGVTDLPSTVIEVTK